ncbi:MAG: TolC family protein [Elusimicrobiota bacterium]
MMTPARGIRAARLSSARAALLSIFFLLAALGVPCPSVQASPLSLIDCLSLAERRAPQAVQASLQETLARQAKSEAAARLMPSVALLGGYTATNNTLYAPILDNSQNAAVDVRYDGFPFSQTWVQSGQKKAQWQAAIYSRLQTKQDVAMLVENLYFSILKNQDVLTKIDQVKKTLARLLTTVMPRYMIGRAPPFDLIKVKTQIAGLSRTHDLILAQLRTDQTRLALILNLPAGEIPDLRTLKRIPPMPDLRSSDISQNPNLKSLNEQVRAADFGLKAAKFERYPQLVYDFQYGYAGLTPNSTILGYVSSIGLRMNVFDWGAISSRVEQGRQSKLLAGNTLQLTEQQDLAGFTQERESAKADLAQLQRLNRLIPDVRRSAMSAVNLYKRGAMGILEATDALQLWLNAMTGERFAYYSYLSDIAALQDLTGTGGEKGAEIYGGH